MSLKNYEILQRLLIRLLIYAMGFDIEKPRKMAYIGAFYGVSREMSTHKSSYAKITLLY